MLTKLLQSISATAAILLTTAISSASPLLSESGLQISLEFPPAPERQGAQSSAGGGTRSGEGSIVGAESRSAAAICSQGDTPLTALIPEETEAQKTISPRPQLFLYVPQTSAEMIEFQLFDQEGNDVYIDTVKLSKTPGILQISLPEDVALEVGQTYNWNVFVSCDSEDPTAVESIQGEIERVAVSEDLKTQIEATSEPLKQAELYAQQRIWQDTLMLMVSLKESNPAAWEQLLTSVGLEAIATVPIVPMTEN
ncbi:MAG: DUF928 domain-containing protein [Microcoleaceae cyanobacterium]